MTQDKLAFDIPTLDDSRGVSPVIGVILMVAITIILAAVIGAFVLGFGADTETAPTASFSGDQDPDPYTDEGTLNITFTHEGGSTVDVDNLAIAFPDSDIDRITSDDLDPSSGTLTAGDAITGNGTVEGDLEDGDRAQLVWESGDTSSVLRTYNINVDETE